jgi:hypothetical protein
VITEAPQPDPGRVGHWLTRAAAATMEDSGEARNLIRELVAEYQLPGEERGVTNAPLQASPALT